MRWMTLIATLILSGCFLEFPAEDADGFYECETSDDCLPNYQCFTFVDEEDGAEESLCESALDEEESEPDTEADTEADVDLDTGTDTESETETGTETDTDTETETETGDPPSLEDMVQVAAGPFMMGCNDAAEQGCDPSESPYHQVELSEFNIDIYEVSAGSYKLCVDAGACTYAGSTTDPLRTYDNNRDDHPINFVTWLDAQAYCSWVGKRLPTEAEWEKASRGDDGRIYPWGNSPEVSCTYAVTIEGDEGCASANTMPVGSKPLGVSPYGAMDMIGNLHEWTADWYGASYYSETPAAGWVNPSGPLDGDMRVLRGGSFDDDLVNLRASRRGATYPEDSHFTTGFRCAR